MAVVRNRRRCCVFILLVAFAAIGNVRKDSLCFSVQSGLDTSPDPGLIYIVNGMRLAAAVDGLVIRDGVISMDSHQLNGTDGRTGDYWKAEL